MLSKTRFLQVIPLLLVMTNDEKNGLRCKIVLNGFALFRPLIKEIHYIAENNLNPKKEKENG